MKKIQTSYFYHWNKIPDELIPRQMKTFADNGAENLVLTVGLAERLLKERDFSARLSGWLKNSGLRMNEAHALCGAAFDLNISDSRRYPMMLEEHKCIMEHASRLGCKSYTMHIGAADCYGNATRTIRDMREAAVKSLESLLPTAEKFNLIIAVENAFEPFNTTDEVLYLVEYFHSPHIACCYDSGHANIKRKAYWKRQFDYANYVLEAWNGSVIEEDSILDRMAPHIVTCHLHDNDGYRDAHSLPGTGTVEWNKIIPALTQCPRLSSMQNETKCDFQVPISKLCRVFEHLCNDCPE